MKWVHGKSWIALWRCMAPALSIVIFCCFAAGLRGQTTSPAEPTASSKRKRVIDLFEQGKRLEALPLAEKVAKANPKDDQILVILAACLVDRAATLSDRDEAGKDRLRARVLLNQARDLGNRSTLALNLLELLKQLPQGGDLKFSENADADRAIRAGEAAFSQRDYDLALQHYAKALQAEPKNYDATLFTANTYDRQKEAVKAGEWYERAIALNPDIETAFRYYADLLAKNGNMGKSRTMLIRAAVAEPYNRIVWRELHAWASLNNRQINEVYVSVPPPQPSESTGEPTAHAFSAAWQAYRDVRANWHDSGEFSKHFPGEGYRHSLTEEAQALASAAQKAEQQIQNDPQAARLAQTDQAIALLLKLYRAGMLEPYVLFSLGDSGIARDYGGYRQKNREKLEAYLDQFVVPPAH